MPPEEIENIFIVKFNELKSTYEATAISLEGQYLKLHKDAVVRHERISQQLKVLKEKSEKVQQSLQRDSQSNAAEDEGIVQAKQEAEKEANAEQEAIRKDRDAYDEQLKKYNHEAGILKGYFEAIAKDRNRPDAHRNDALRRLDLFSKTGTLDPAFWTWPALNDQADSKTVLLDSHGSLVLRILLT